LSALVDHSLLRLDEEGDTVRYTMLETIREFGLEQLETAGDLETLRARHAVHYLGFAERAAAELQGTQQVRAVREFDGEADNLRSVLTWSIEHTEPALGLRLGRALIGYWQLRGLLSEGRTWLEHVLLLPELPDVTLKARVLNNLGNLANDLGDYVLARSAYEQSLAIWRATSERRAIATVLNNLGQVVGTQGDYASARTLQEESLAILEELGDQRGIALPLHNLGNLAHHEEDYPSAISYHELALAIRKSAGDISGAAYSSCELAHVLHHRGDNDRAKQLYQTAIGHFREAEDPLGLAIALGGYAEVAREEQAHAVAGAHFAEALNLWLEIGARQSVACLEEVAALAAERNRPVQATRLISAASTIRAEIGEPAPPVVRRELDALIELLRVELGGTEFNAAWSSAKLLDPDAAIGEAIAEAMHDPTRAL
jgi:tetratricopeptide (TPR) repeat protein